MITRVGQSNPAVLRSVNYPFVTWTHASLIFLDDEVNTGTAHALAPAPDPDPLTRENLSRLQLANAPSPMTQVWLDQKKKEDGVCVYPPDSTNNQQQ